jgi:hypothetical protein
MRHAARSHAEALIETPDAIARDQRAAPITT